MRQLLALFDRGALGTFAEPTWVQCRVSKKGAPVQNLTDAGTLGTHGTLSCADQTCAWPSSRTLGRLPIVLDISVIEAHGIAKSEIDANLVRTNLPIDMLAGVEPSEIAVLHV